MTTSECLTAMVECGAIGVVKGTMPRNGADAMCGRWGGGQSWTESEFGFGQNRPKNPHVDSV